MAFAKQIHTLHVGAVEFRRPHRILLHSPSAQRELEIHGSQLGIERLPHVGVRPRKAAANLRLAAIGIPLRRKQREHFFLIDHAGVRHHQGP